MSKCRAVLCIDNGKNLDLSLCISLYNTQPLRLRWREHILCLMYCQSKNRQLIDVDRPQINLRSNNRVKFKKSSVHISCT